eukprot:TRINITY_DN110474_c0_g1_i1.p1 TRINITY_DN110474_c0_g1~~TRINITY_DN110474_c0_g1_i1.p1  ORF type:complete len:273 (+),score=71.98 TRINITY_DN110474_c0_g1_i1:32-850(+)
MEKDLFAILRIPAASVRKESDLPKLKERATHLVRQYQKVNKHDKAREVEKAYRSLKEKLVKQFSSAGSRAFSTGMVNKPAKRSAPESGPQVSANKKYTSITSSAVSGPSPKPAAAITSSTGGGKSREERMREKLEARRQAKAAESEDKDRRAAAIREKLAAKRAKNGLSRGALTSPNCDADSQLQDQSAASPSGGVASPHAQSAASPPEALASPDAQSAASPQDGNASPEAAEANDSAALEDPYLGDDMHTNPEEQERLDDSESTMAEVDFF